MNISFSKVTLPLRGNIVDFCLEIQSKGVVVSIIPGDFPDLRFHLPQDLPYETTLLNIRSTVRDGVDEYTFRDEHGVISVVYGKKWAEMYHPPRIYSVSSLRPSNPMVTFHNKNFAKSFQHYPEDVVMEEIII